MMTPVSMYHWRKWQRRALTLNSKAGELLGEILAQLGEDSFESDIADAVLERTEELLHLIDRQCAARGGLK